LEKMGAECHSGDLVDRKKLLKASQNCDVVYHVAGKTGVWGAYTDYYSTNVTGTETIIETCLENNIQRLVYTSTPSVVFDGSNEENINESRPCPGKFLNHYQSTKARAEKIVLAANSDRLATVALRPHLIWGPHDPHLVARILDRARHGKLRLVQGNNLVDTTYIDNAVSAHLLAATALALNSSCSGKTYFISNGEPLPMATIINRILAAAGLAPVRAYISPTLAYSIGAVSELLYTLLGKRDEPLLTRFVARQLSCAHWYDISASKRDIGYDPVITIDEGMRRLQLSLKPDNDPVVEKPSA